MIARVFGAGLVGGAILPERAVASEPAAASGPTMSAEEILGESARRGPLVEDVRARLTFFDQKGRGYQSKAGPPPGPGDERLLVLQPLLSTTIRQDDRRFSHVIGLSADVVTAASPDALDAVSSASRWNEAVTLAVTTRFEPQSDRRWDLRYGIHLEEHWRTGIAGLGYDRAFNEANTLISASLNFIYDYFDDLHPRGWNDGQTSRITFNHNLGWTQVLSPTTLAVLGYGLTFQTGTLENGWNSVFVRDAETYGCADDPEQLPEYDCENRRRENFPRTRIRNAFSAQINQHVPRTRTTLKGRYRYYLDDFGLRAHTFEARAYQWIGRWMYLRGSYRFHHQTGVDFFTTSIPDALSEDAFITADSDLARFVAHEFGVKAVVYLKLTPGAAGGPRALDLGYRRYLRTNDLSMNVFSIGFSQEF